MFFALHGDVEFKYAALMGIPATVGVIGGTSIQQRVPTRTLSLAFVGLLTAIGIVLLV
jgi:uncharacterized membrane protein YfcA